MIVLEELSELSDTPMQHSKSTLNAINPIIFLYENIDKPCFGASSNHSVYQKKFESCTSVFRISRFSTLNSAYMYLAFHFDSVHSVFTGLFLCLACLCTEKYYNIKLLTCRNLTLCAGVKHRVGKSDECLSLISQRISVVK